jgi:phosphinothricin acetyltransferase
MIRPARSSDAAAVCEIYNHFVLHTTVTFEEDAVLENDMADRIGNSSDTLPWLVFEVNNAIVGYAHASAWKSRCAYRFSAETSVYLAPEHSGRGIGSALYQALLTRLAETTCHSLLAGIALPNDASVALHEKLGFEKVGQFREVGRKFDRWVDVGYWELIFPPTD